MMRARRQPRSRAFSLIELMIAIAILGVVIAAIYSTWTAILRSSKVSLDAAASVQRSRIAMQCMEEALTYAQMFSANAGLYWFGTEEGNNAALSFVARLPESYPRAGKFGDMRVRRLTFSLEEGSERDTQLVLRQQPILMEPDQDEIEHPLVLARSVEELSFEFWDPEMQEWMEEWTFTNQLPQLVRVKLVTALQKSSGSLVRDESTILVSPAAMAVLPPMQGAQAGRPPQVPRR